MKVGSFFEHIEAIAKTDVGLCRDENQDFFGVVKADGLQAFFVADGMGGASGGCLASSKSIEFVGSSLQAFEGVPTADELAEIVRGANSAINNMAVANPKLHGMGTTLVGLAFSETRMLMVNVGDSRIYRLREGKLYQLTSDHTVWNDLVQSGSISLGGAFANEISHMLTRSIGPDSMVQVDSTEIEVLENDIYLLCSDGLYNMVLEREIVAILEEQATAEAAESLIALANKGGGTDNVTVLIVKVLPGVQGLPKCEETLPGLRVCDLQQDKPALQSLRDEDSRRLGLQTVGDRSNDLMVLPEGEQNRKADRIFEDASLAETQLINPRVVKKRSSDIHLYAIGALLALAVQTGAVFLTRADGIMQWVWPVNTPESSEPNSKTEVINDLSVAEIVFNSINSDSGNTYSRNVDSSSVESAPVSLQLPKAELVLDSSVRSMVQVWHRRREVAAQFYQRLTRDVESCSSLECLNDLFQSVKQDLALQNESLQASTNSQFQDLSEKREKWLDLLRALGQLSDTSDLSQLRDKVPDKLEPLFKQLERARAEMFEFESVEGEDSEQAKEQAREKHAALAKTAKSKLQELAVINVAKLERQLIKLLAEGELVEDGFRHLPIINYISEQLTEVSRLDSETFDNDNFRKDSNLAAVKRQIVEYFKDESRRLQRRTKSLVADFLK